MAKKNIIFIQDYKQKKENLLTLWLTAVIEETYGKEDIEFVKNNPYMRLLLKYDGLSQPSKEQMFCYTEKAIAQYHGKKLSQRNLLSELLGMGNLETWEKIEEYTNHLFYKENTI